MSQGSQNIGKRAIPTLLQGVFSDDVANRATTAQKIDIFNLIGITCLDGNVINWNRTLFDQELSHIFGVNVYPVSLVLAGSFNLDQHNRANVFTGILLVVFGLCFQVVSKRLGL